MNKEDRKYPGYRKLRVERVTKRESRCIEINFRHYAVSLSIPLKHVKKYKLETLSAGDIIYIKGKKGNEDVDFWGGKNLIEDIKFPKA